MIKRAKKFDSKKKAMEVWLVKSEPIRAKVRALHAIANIGLKRKAKKLLQLWRSEAVYLT